MGSSARAQTYLQTECLLLDCLSGDYTLQTWPSTTEYGPRDLPVPFLCIPGNSRRSLFSSHPFQSYLPRCLLLSCCGRVTLKSWNETLLLLLVSSLIRLLCWLSLLLPCAVKTTETATSLVGVGHAFLGPFWVRTQDNLGRLWWWCQLVAGCVILGPFWVSIHLQYFIVSISLLCTFILFPKFYILK